MEELLKLEINEFILRIPEAYLRVSKGGRLDFPGRMIVCPGNGWMSDNCNVCLHHYLFIQRTYGTQIEDVENDVNKQECISTRGMIPVIDKYTVGLLKRKIDTLENDEYEDTVLPIIKKLYIALIIEEERNK